MRAVTRQSARFGTSRSMARVETILLTPDDELRDIQLEAFILYDFLRPLAACNDVGLPLLRF
jgi:hypothetical protein